MTTDLQGYLAGYGTVWFHPGGIANILSLSNVEEKYQVSYNSTGGGKLLVHLPRGKIRSFTQWSILLRHGCRGYDACQYCRL